MSTPESLLQIETWLFNYLLNSLWQVPLLFAAAWLVTRSLRRTGPTAQHCIWVGTLTLQLLLPACTFSPHQLFDALVQLIPWRTSHETTTALVTITTGPVQAHNGLQLSTLFLTIIVTAYALTLLYFTGRLLWGLRNTAALRHAIEPVTLSEDAAAFWSRCSHLFAARNTQLAASSAAPYPLTIGIRRPLILLPAGMASAVPADDLAAALAHEFAHIRRHDFAKNLAYTLLTIPIAWHPILWLTRKQIEETREMICDALAAEALTGTQPYARSLLRLASLFVNATPDRTLHAIGIFDANIFERRVMNLTHKPIQLRGLRRIALTAACLTLGLATCASALALRLNASATPAQSEASQPPALPPGTVVRISGGVVAGQRVSFVAPIYPPEAKKAKLSGTVLLDAVIGKDGKISKLVAIKGPEVFRDSAVNAVRQWAYKPYLLNGDPVEVETTITVNFSLNPDKTPSTPSPDPTAQTPSPTASNAHPIVIRTGEVKFPAEAKKDKINGTVLVSLIVGKDGVPKDVAVKRGLRPDCDQSALEAVKDYRFKPALHDGSPIDMPLFIDVAFQTVN